MITFITPYRDIKQAEKWRVKLLKKFPKAQVILINGNMDKGGVKSFFDVWKKALPDIKNKYVCLTHDDTEYLEIPDLHNYFANDNGKWRVEEYDHVGMIGVAGTTVLHKDQPWWFSKERALGHILSGEIYHTGDKGKEISIFGDFGEVVVLDGVCLITTKELLEEILPVCLEKDYGTWDFYDHIFSLEYLKKGYKILTVPIKMIHSSRGGDKRQSFFDSLEKFKNEYLTDPWRTN